MKEEIIKDYVSGIQTKDLAEKYNLNKQQIRRIIRLAGVARPSGGVVTYDPQIAIDMWNDGHTLDHIADHLKVNRNSVYEQLKKYNIDTTCQRKIDRIRLKALIDDGKSDFDISKELDCSEIRIQQIRREEFGVYTDSFERSTQLISSMMQYFADNPDCIFDDVRSKFSELDYNTLIRRYDQAFPNRRDNGFRSDLISIDCGDDRLSDIINCLNNGESKRSIMHKFPVTPTTLNQIIQDMVPNYKPKMYSIPDDIYNKLSSKDWCVGALDRCYNNDRETHGYAGITKYEFDNIVGVDIVIKYIRSHGLEIKSFEDRFPLLKDKNWLEENYKTKSYAQIADEIGVSHPTIRQALIDNGIDINREVGVSKIEKQLVERIREFYDGTIIENDRSLISPSEVDILLPDLKIGIEVCGLYWHSEKFKSNTYHFDKMVMCNDKGYHLITIFEDELMFKFDSVITEIKNLISAQTIDVSECEVVALTTEQANKFINDNCIQGCSINTQIGIGLKFNGELISTATFNQRGGDAVLSRFASNTNVVGGLKAMLDAFIKQTKCGKISTAVDLRWFNTIRNTIEMAGFVNVRHIKPKYCYNDYISKKRLSIDEFNTQKTLKLYDPNLTEKENANNNNYYAIYDCGYIAYDYIV